MPGGRRSPLQKLFKERTLTVFCLLTNIDETLLTILSEVLADRVVMRQLIDNLPKPHLQRAFFEARVFLLKLFGRSLDRSIDR